MNGFTAGKLGWYLMTAGIGAALTFAVQNGLLKQQTIASVRGDLTATQTNVTEVQKKTSALEANVVDIGKRLDRIENKIDKLIERK